MSGFTMPGQTLVTPTGTIDSPLDHAVCPDGGTTIRASFTATGSVSFTGHFRNKNNNGLVGPQGFVNVSSGNWTWAGDPNFNSTTPWGFELDTITNNGHNITVTLSVDSGTPYSGIKIRRSGAWAFTWFLVRRSGAWLYTPLYIRRSNAWALLHK